MNLETILATTKFHLNQIFPILEAKFGVQGKIYYPVSQSVYDDDSNITYNDLPDEERNLLLVNVFDNSFLDSSLATDVTLEDVIWYVPSSYIPPPEGSKVEVTIGSSTKQFQIDYIKKFQGDVYYQIYLRAMR